MTFPMTFINTCAYKRNDTVLGTYTVVNRRAVYCYCCWYDIFLRHAPCLHGSMLKVITYRRTTPVDRQ